MKPNLTEATINKADINAIFKDAAYLRSKPGIGKFFGLGKEKIDVEDLRQAWAKGIDSKDGSEISGYSDDTADIKRILLKFGFEEPEIKKVFAHVFKTGKDTKKEYDDKKDAPVASEIVQQIADFSKKNGLQDDLLKFLESEFADELGIRKATNEEVRQIFTAIVQEERTARANLIKEEERTLLGRMRK